MLNKSLKTIVDIGVVCLLIVGLTSCASGGGSSGLVAVSTPQPPASTPPSYTPPEWNGTSYTDTNPIESTGEYADITYNRIDADEFMNANPTWSFDGNSDYERTNMGLLHISNNGYVGAVTTQFESQPEGFTYGIDPANSPITGDFNGDGLMDVMFSHNFGPNNNAWLPTSRLIVLINQGNGRLEVDPNAFVDGEFPTVGPLFQSHVADFNGDGVDDFINIGESGAFVLSSADGLVNQTETLISQLMDMGATTQTGEYNIWTHTTAIGDLNNDGTIDMFIPSNLHDQDCSTPYGCSAFAMVNDGAGNFSLGSVLFPNMSSVLASVIEDFDGDGFGDVAVSMPLLKPDHIFYNERLCDTCSGVVMYGNSDLDYTRDISLLPDYMVDNMIGLQLIAIDVNNDGFKDLMLMGTGDGYGEGSVDGSHNYYAENYLQVFLNSGDGRGWTDATGTYIDASIYNDLPKHNTHGTKPDWLIQVDLDGDGDLDLWSGVDYYAPYYINDNGVYRLAGIIGDVVPVPEGCPSGGGNCGQNTQFHLPIDIDGDGIIDFVQAHEWGNTEVSNLTLSQLMGRQASTQQAFAFGSNGTNSYRDSGLAGAGYTNYIMQLAKSIATGPSNLLSIDDMILNSTEEFLQFGRSTTKHNGMFIKQTNNKTMAIQNWGNSETMAGYGFHFATEQMKNGMSNHSAKLSSIMGFGRHKNIYGLVTYSDIEITNARNTIFAGVAQSKTDASSFVSEFGITKSAFTYGLNYTFATIDGFDESGNDTFTYKVNDASINAFKAFITFDKNIFGINTLVKVTENFTHDPYKVSIETRDGSFFGAIDPVKESTHLWYNISKQYKTNYGTVSLSYQDYIVGPKGLDQLIVKWDWKF